MCWRLGCLFRDMPPPQGPTDQDNYTTLLVIGASGMTGSALLEAAVACVWFRVIAFTRNSENLEDNQHVKNGQIDIVVGDMLEPNSLCRAMKDVDVVFFTTAYWDTRDVECEITQGTNVVEAASKTRVKHLLYVGTPYNNKFASVECRSLIGRERVEQLVIKCGVPCTILHMGFYYENFLSVFKPHMVEPMTYALALPMENIPLNCGSVLDFAHCIAKIILQPSDHIGMTIKLSTGYHTVTQLVAWMDRQFTDFTFYDPKMPVEDFKQLAYAGSEELSAMFVFLQSHPNTIKWDQKLAYDLCPSARSFPNWLAENEKSFVTCLNEDVNLDELVSVQVGSFMRESFEQPVERQKKMNVKSWFRTKEDENSFERRAALCDEVLIRWGFMSMWRLLLDSDG